MKIKDAELVLQITGEEKIPVSNSSGKPAAVTVNLILEKVPEPDLTGYATNQKINSLLSISEYEFVDLGLPSGLRWATYNVGATKPEEYGLYFAWGETKGYPGITGSKSFSWKDYKLCNGSDTTFIKYNFDSSYGIVDNLDILLLTDDAVHQSDNSCTIPTYADYDELLKNVTLTWESLNDVFGCTLTSKINGNSIFMPAAGYYSNGKGYQIGSRIYLWSNELNHSLCLRSWCLCLEEDYDDPLFYYLRNRGFSLRPVTRVTLEPLSEKVDNLESKIDELEKDIPTKLSLLNNDANYILEDSLVYGVYAVTPTNRLVDLEHADTSCVGVAVFMPDIKYIINKHDLNNSLTLYWGKNLKGLDVPGIENLGLYNFDFTGGKNNTNALISSYTTLGVEMDSRDVSKSLQTFYESGDTDWYIPSNGLLVYMYSNFAKINEILSKIGGTLLVTTTDYWSSNESSTDDAISALLKDGNVLYPIPKDSLCRVRLIKDLPEQKLVKERIDDLETEVYELGINCATKEEIPTKTSLLENDSSYVLDDVITSEFSIKAVSATGELLDLDLADTSCVGVAYRGESCSFIIAKHDVLNSSKFYWGKNLKGLDVPNLDNFSSVGSLFNDLNGDLNTKAIASSYDHFGVEVDDSDMCKGVETYKENYTDWYIPTAAQLLECYYYTAEINEMLNKIGGTPLSTSDFYWSSTEHSANQAWVAKLVDGRVLINLDKDTLGLLRLVRDPKTIKLRINTLESKVTELEKMPEIDAAPFEFVDLGLPSGLKWATCNVGATSPEEFGLYFAFGETEGYADFTEQKLFVFDDYKWHSNGVLTKYNTDASYGEVDNLTTLELVDDAAHQIDNSIKIPTIDDLNEFLNNTTPSITTLNGFRIIKFTSKINNNFILIPLAGYLELNNNPDAWMSAYIASSCIDTEITFDARCLQVTRAGKASLAYKSRSCGISIRPVQYTEGLYKLDMRKYYTKSEISNVLDKKLSDFTKNSEMNLKINEIKEIITNNEMTLMKTIMDLNTRISNLENQN